MSRYVSLNTRMAQDSQASDEIEVVLIQVRHPLVNYPVKLSSDNKDRLSYDPLEYGFWSTWGNDPEEPFKFVLMGAEVPDDVDDAPAEGALIIDVGDSKLAEILTSTTIRATIDMALLLASDPDTINEEWLGLKMVNASGDGTQIRCQFAKDAILEESCPAQRMTRQRMPGLHR